MWNGEESVAAQYQREPPRDSHIPGSREDEGHQCISYALASASPFRQRTRSLGGVAGGYGTAEEIAGMVAYLAGPEAAYITGASLMIDGGFSAQVRAAINGGWMPCY